MYQYFDKGFVIGQLEQELRAASQHRLLQETPVATVKNPDPSTLSQESIPCSEQEFQEVSEEVTSLPHHTHTLLHVIKISDSRGLTLSLSFSLCYLSSAPKTAQTIKGEFRRAHRSARLLRSKPERSSVEFNLFSNGIERPARRESSCCVTFVTARPPNQAGSFYCEFTLSVPTNQSNDAVTWNQMEEKEADYNSKISSLEKAMQGRLRRADDLIEEKNKQKDEAKQELQAMERTLQELRKTNFADREELRDHKSFLQDVRSQLATHKARVLNLEETVSFSFNADAYCC